MPDVIHNEADHCFSFLPDHVQEPATLTYNMLSDSQVDFTHTFVPPALRNQGLAEKLVRTGLTWARDNQLQIVASCWYVDKFLQRGR